MRYGSPATEFRWAPPGPPAVRAYSHLAGPSRLAGQLGRPAGTDDGSLIAAALDRWGPDAATRLAGPFVFAAHSGDRLLLGRDQLGQFPLHYARIRDGIVVSVDVEAVLAHPQVDGDVDLELAACLYARAFGPLLRRTPFRSVHKVPPGTVLTLTATGVHEHRYWRPEEVRVVRRDPRDWAAQLRSLLPVVVADALPAGEAVGAHVSGGLDCTTVAAVAEDVLLTRGRRLSAVYSWAPPATAAPPPPGGTGVRDERWLVERIAAERGWVPRYVPLGPELARAHDTGEHPLTRPWLAREREAWVAPDAAARGVRVLLSGWGGDEFASFNSRAGYRALARRGHLLSAARMVRRRGEVIGVPAGPRAIAVTLATALLPGAVVEPIRASRGRPAPGAERSADWLAFPLAAEVLRQDQRRLRAAATPHAMQLALHGLGHLSARCEAWSLAAARVGLSYRFPLLDPRVVTLALSAPPACYLHDGWDRYGFRLAVQSVLPPELAWNPTKAEPVLNAERRAAPAGVHGTGLDLRLAPVERAAARAQAAQGEPSARRR